MYSLFYNKNVIGDVLLISFENETIPNRKEVDNNIVRIYENDRLIGINIFNISSTVKIHADGLIPLPANQFIDVINSVLIQNKLEPLAYKEESGFKIGKIISCKAHEESDHLHILKVDVGNEVLDIVCGASNVSLGAVVVVATVGTVTFDGTEIKSGKLLGVTSSGMCCSERELNLTKEQEKRGLLLLDDTYQIGADFFQK
ncbi:MAG: DUF4479 domain-containing protein [Bacilli bacterium]